MPTTYNKEFYQKHKKKISEYRKQYRLIHKDILSEQKRRYRIAHKEQCKEEHQRWYLKHREERLQYEKVYNKKYYAKNKDIIREKKKQYNEEHRESIRKVSRERYQNDAIYRETMRKRSYEKKYGITIEDYNEMVEKQGGKCLICGKEFKLVVDHNHKTGCVRGLLCPNCNFGIGFLQDDVELLQKAINYLSL